MRDPTDEGRDRLPAAFTHADPFVDRIEYERPLWRSFLRDLMRWQLLVDTEIADLELDGSALVL
jgi:hypothetical protein